eukprot:471743-Pelagomonas_calceolata.AAC.4
MELPPTPGKSGKRQKLGLDHQRTGKLAHELHACFVKHTYKLVTTRRTIENQNLHSQVTSQQRIKDSSTPEHDDVPLAASAAANAACVSPAGLKIGS